MLRSKATAWAWWSSARRTRGRCSSTASHARTSTSAREVSISGLLRRRCLLPLLHLCPHGHLLHSPPAMLCALAQTACSAPGWSRGTCLWLMTITALLWTPLSRPWRDAFICSKALLPAACRGHDHHVDRHGAGHRHRSVLPGGRRLQLCLVSELYVAGTADMLLPMARSPTDTLCSASLRPDVWWNREQIQEVQTRSEERRGGDGSPSSSGASEGNLGSRSRQPVDEFDQLGTSLEGGHPVLCPLCGRGHLH